MPKMKSKKLASKKFHITASGKAKHARTNTSHNTGKKSAKRMRHLSGTKLVDDTNMRDVRRLLPYLSAAK